MVGQVSSAVNTAVSPVALVRQELLELSLAHILSRQPSGKSKESLYPLRRPVSAYCRSSSVFTYNVVFVCVCVYACAGTFGSQSQILVPPMPRPHRKFHICILACRLLCCGVCEVLPDGSTRDGWKTTARYSARPGFRRRAALFSAVVHWRRSVRHGLVSCVSCSSEGGAADVVCCLTTSSLHITITHT